MVNEDCFYLFSSFPPAISFSPGIRCHSSALQEGSTSCKMFRVFAGMLKSHMFSLVVKSTRMTAGRSLNIRTPAGSVPAVSSVTVWEMMCRLFSPDKGDDEQERRQIISPLYLSPQGDT